MNDNTAQQNILYLIFFLAILAIGTLAPRTLSWLPGISGLALVINSHCHSLEISYPPRTLLFIFGTILIWLFFSLFWSIAPETTIDRLFNLLTIFGGGFLWITASQSTPLHRMAPARSLIFIVYIAISCILMIEHHTQLALSNFFAPSHEIKTGLWHLNRSMVVLALFAFPLLFIAKMTISNRKISALWQFAILAFLLINLYFCKSQTAQLTGALGILFYYFFPIYKKICWRAVGASIVMYCLINPFSLIQSAYFKHVLSQNSFAYEASIPQRLEIWHFIASKALEKPFFGHGIEATRYMTSDKWMDFMNADTALHPHNAVLQIWVEFGFVGILGLIALIIHIISRCHSYNNIQHQRFTLTMFIIVFCMANTGYGLWQSWHIGLFLCLLGLIIFAIRFVDNHENLSENRVK